MHIPITKPYITKREFELIRETLDSGWLVQGPKVKEFERLIASYTGARYAIAVNSCTSGQMLMSEIIDLKPGEEVIVPAFTWISTAHAVEYKGARPVFCDIDLDTFNIDLEALKEKIDTTTRAIYPVSMFGLAANMPEISRLSRKNDLRVVEDVACGLGAKIGDQHCGVYGMAGVLSFHPRKSITTGEGGMIITNDEGVDRLARSMREHGAVTGDHQRHLHSPSHQMSEYPRLGFNMRMTDMQAAMGIAQFEKLEDILCTKRQLAAEYKENLGHLSWLQLPDIPQGYHHTFQTYCTLYKPGEACDALEKNDENRLRALHEERNAVMSRLQEKGIMTRPGTHALHIQKYYQNKYGFREMDFPRSYAADRLTLALPFYPTITSSEKAYLFDQIQSISP